MLETQKKRSDAPPGEVPSDLENPDEQSEETAENSPRDPTRYGDWEVGGRCIDF